MRDQIGVMHMSLDLAVRLALPFWYHAILLRWSFDPGHTGDLERQMASHIERSTHPCVNHESQDVLYAVERQHPSVDTFPHPFVISHATFDGRPELVDKLVIGDGDLEVWTLLIALEAKDVFTHDHLHGMNGRLMLRELPLEKCSVGSTVIFGEGHRRCDI